LIECFTQAFFHSCHICLPFGSNGRPSSRERCLKGNVYSRCRRVEVSLVIENVVCLLDIRDKRQQGCLFRLIHHEPTTINRRHRTSRRTQLITQVLSIPLYLP